MSSSIDSSSGSGTGPASGGKPGAKGPMKSRQLDHTLRELESAFSDWESLNTGKALSGPDAPAGAIARDLAAATPAADPTEEEFRKKTKKLLMQLREQLSDLMD